MSQNDEIATQQQLYTCGRPGCGVVLGLLLPDGRLQIPADGAAVICLIEWVGDCAVCGFRNSYDRCRRVPGFVEKWYPDGEREDA